LKSKDCAVAGKQPQSKEQQQPPSSQGTCWPFVWNVLGTLVVREGKLQKRMKELGSSDFTKIMR
jgi:hypothetical protein